MLAGFVSSVTVASLLQLCVCCFMLLCFSRQSFNLVSRSASMRLKPKRYVGFSSVPLLGLVSFSWCLRFWRSLLESWFLFGLFGQNLRWFFPILDSQDLFWCEVFRWFSHKAILLSLTVPQRGSHLTLLLWSEICFVFPSAFYPLPFKPFFFKSIIEGFIPSEKFLLRPWPGSPILRVFP